jgi:hypothetical protein
MKKLITAFLIVAAAPLFASNQPLFTKYESARQALLTGSVPGVQKAARDLAQAASSAKQPAIAATATKLATAANIKEARTAFASVSDEVIRFRDAQKGDKPAVAYCSMEKKSWLQPKGAITNPYVDGGMRACGEFKR